MLLDLLVSSSKPIDIFTSIYTHFTHFIVLIQKVIRTLRKMIQMTHKYSMVSIFLMLLFTVTCFGQDKAKTEPHRYGGWYCPDNFGFVPVDIQKLDEVPAIADRLPTQEELQNNMSLINVDTEKYPDAKALEMKLPRVAKLYSHRKGMDELVIIIQAIVVSGDTVVGYRFPNGGNGSGWIDDVTFLSEDEVAEYGSQPFFYATSEVKASKEDIWNAISKTKYFKTLGEKFDQQEYFASRWNSESWVNLKHDSESEKALGYVGMVFGNPYLHIDYNRNGFHYSEKLLMIENQEDKTTKLFFASGPYPEDFESHKNLWQHWFEGVKKASVVK